MKYSHLTDNSSLHIENSGLDYRQICAIACLIIIQLLGPYATLATFLGLCLYAMHSSETSLKALSLGVVLIALNPGIFSGSSNVMFFRWILLFVAATRIYLSWIRNGMNIPVWLLWLLLFSIVAGITSAVSSPMVLLSFAKIFVFFIGLSSVLIAFQQTGNVLWRSWFTSVFVSVLLTSLPLLFVSEGYFRNSIGFQGILGHPQTYAIYMILPTFWMTGLWLSPKNVPPLIPLVTIIGWITIFASKGRIAVVAVALSLLITIVIAMISRSDWRGKFIRIFRNPLVITTFLIILFLGIFQGELVYDAVRDYVGKSYFQDSESIDIIDGFNRARGRQIVDSWQNFVENPIWGIGFGIASDKELSIFAEQTSLGIPLSAPVEKGFLPTALLEEGGILAAMPFVLLILSLSRPVFKFADLPAAWLFFCAILVNCGEMIFFTPGGLGLYTWLAIGFVLHECKRAAVNSVSQC